MFDRFTDRTRKVMGYAREEAERLKHDHIGTEHVLLGLVKERRGVATNVLENLGIDLDKVRAEVEERVEKGSTESTGPMPVDKHAKRAIDHAVKAAKRLKHKYVGTEHLLLGLLREEKGMAAEVLRGLGVKLDDVRHEVMRLLGAGSEKPAAQTPQQLLPRIEELEREKLAAVGAQDFERAARLRDEVEKLRKEAEGPRETMPVSPRVRKALEYAKEEARRDGSASVDIEHLRRGIERVEKEENS